MKNKINLVIYKLIKYFFTIGAIVSPFFLLTLKYVYNEDISFFVILISPLACIPFIKVCDYSIRKTKKRNGWY